MDIDSYICDISNPEDIARVAKEIREDIGEPTILVNNAGIINGKSILDLSIEDIKRYIGEDCSFCVTVLYACSTHSC